MRPEGGKKKSGFVAVCKFSDDLRPAAVGVCVLAFCIGIVFVQRSGNYFVTMFDDYSATLPLLIVVILENVAVAWVYGTDR